MDLVIQLLAGALGGTLAGGALKTLSLGPVLNAIVGLLGGGIGGQILAMMAAGDPAAAPDPDALDLGGIVGSVLSGGVGGAALLTIVGAIRRAMSR